MQIRYAAASCESAHTSKYKFKKLIVWYSITWYSSLGSKAHKFDTWHHQCYPLQNKPTNYSSVYPLQFQLCINPVQYFPYWLYSKLWLQLPDCLNCKWKEISKNGLKLTYALFRNPISFIICCLSFFYKTI